MSQTQQLLGDMPPGLRQQGFRKFEHSAVDIVLAAAFNTTGTRLTLTSADHRIRVFTREPDGKWALLDQWRGHDAEILDIRWIGSNLGQVFATIGDDNKFKLWREDPSQSPSSGRKYRCIYSQSPSNHVSYVSFDFKTVRHQVWLAIVTLDGLLSLMEPSEFESLSAWKTLDAMYPFGQHLRGSEPKFKLSLHQSEKPHHRAISAGLDPQALSLAVAANGLIKIFCAIKADEGNYQFGELLEIDTVAPVINDISWAPGTLRHSDLIAAACDDGCVRIYELTALHAQKSVSNVGDGLDDLTLGAQKQTSIAVHNARSGIGAGLAGASRSTQLKSSNILIKLDWKEFCILVHDEDLPVWRVQWINDGKKIPGSLKICLELFLGSGIMSTGDSGNLRLWKQNLNGEFVEFANVGPT